MDAKPEPDAELTESDLLSFVAGEASPALKKRIAEEMEKEGSFTQRLFRRVQSVAADPFNVDWAALLDSECKQNGGGGPDRGGRKG